MRRVIRIASLRWLCVVPALVISFVASLIVLIPIDKFLDFILWHSRFLPSERYIQLHLPWDGAVAALLFVLSGAAVAPGHRRIVALGLFMLGASLAVHWLESMTGPASHIFPDPSGLHLGWPVGGILAGGALGVACVLLRRADRLWQGQRPMLLFSVSL